MKIFKIPSLDGIANLEFCFINGSQTEKEGSKGLLHLMEHMHYRDASSNRVKRCKRELEEIKAVMNAYTSENCINFFTTFLPSDFKIALKNMQDLVYRKNFNDADLEVESKVVQRELVDYYDNPSFIVRNTLETMLFDDLYIDTLGRSEDILSSNVEKLNSLYNDLFGLSNLVVLLSGPQEFLDTVPIESLYPDEHTLNNVPRSLEVSKYSLRRASYKEVDKGLQTIHLSIGAPFSNSIEGNTEGWLSRVVLTCAATMLGGTWESPLLKVLREEKGFCYSIGSFLRIGNRFDIFTIGGQINPEHKVEALSLINEMLGNFYLNEDLFNLSKKRMIKMREWEKIDGSSLIDKKILELTTGYKQPTLSFLESEFTFEMFKSFIKRKDFFNPINFSTALCL